MLFRSEFIILSRHARHTRDLCLAANADTDDRGPGASGAMWLREWELAPLLDFASYSQPGHCCADSGDPMLLEAMFFVPQLSALMRRNVSRHGTLRRPVASPDPARAGHPREMSTAHCAHARRETQKVRIEAWQQPGPEHQGCREAEQQPRAESSL